MTKPVFGSIWLGVILFLLAAYADPIMLVSDTFRNEPSATISARVTNSHGKFLGNALIEEINLGSHLVVGAKTNKGDSNRMAVLPQGPYKATARAVGFRTIANHNFKMEAQDKIALDGSSLLASHSYRSKDLQLQPGANDGTQQATSHVKFLMPPEVGVNLLAESFNLFPALKGDEEGSLHPYSESSDSILPSSQLNTIIVNPMESEFERDYGLLPKSFASNPRAGVGTLWKVAGSDNPLDTAEIPERIFFQGGGRHSEDRLENFSSEQIVAALDTQKNIGKLSTVSVVSESSGLMMMGASMIGLAIVIRRSNSRRKDNSLVVEVNPNIHQTALSPPTSGAMTNDGLLTMVKTTAASCPTTRSASMGAA